MTERQFREITNKRIRRESVGSVKELVEVTREYIEEWNKNSKPFKRTKPAKDITDSI
jgi:hypothetical protein